MIRVIGDGFDSFLENAGGSESQPIKIDYVYYNNSIYGFGNQEFTEKPEFIRNGGKFVKLNLGLSTNPDNLKWSSSKFDAYHESKNLQEYNCKATYFSDESGIYSLITQQSGASFIQNIYRWNDEKNKFENIELDAPESIEEKEYALIEVVIVDGKTKNGNKMVILSNNGKYYIHEINIGESKVTITRIGEIKDRDEFPLANERALKAAISGDNLYITFGVDGCGLMWVQNKALVYNIPQKQAKEIEISGDSPFFSIRPYTSWIGLDKNSWIFSCGSGRAGRGQSKFSGETWAIEHLNSENPSWKKLNLTIPDEYEGTALKDNSAENGIFVIGKAQTIRASV